MVASLSADDLLRPEYDEEKISNVTQAIDKYMQPTSKKDKIIHKILLLGTGSCGKSTLYKQLKQIYKYGLDESEFLESKFVIRSNVVNSILVLLKKSQILYEMDEDKHSDCYIDLDEDPNIVKHIQRVLEFAIPNAVEIGVDEITAESSIILYESISYLWSLPQVKNTFDKRQYFSFIENMDYFFDKLDEIFKIDYEPSLQDTLKCNIRTTGLVEEKYIINDVQFNIFDTGGQRNERKKWIGLFETVQAIIFVAALNHYCQVLFEDECYNAMQESLELFDEVCNAKWFRKTEIILFLNKDDLFRQRLKEGISLSVAFGDEWNGPEYESKDDEQEDKEFLDHCHEASCAFIRNQYEILNKNPYKKVFVHITTATNKENIESVFWDVQNIIVSSRMKSSGLV